MLKYIAMDTIDNILNNVKDEIKNYFNTSGLDYIEVNFEISSNQRFGDISTNVAMKYSKELEMKPIDFAQNIVDYLSKQDIEGVEKIECVSPGFINLFFDKNFFKKYLYEILKLEDNFGKNKNLKGQRWVVEHTSPNPNKSMHLGHLRNNLVGMGIVRLLKWNGAEVVSDAVYNDRGIAIAKLIYGFLAYMKKDESLPTDESVWSENKDKWYSPKEKGMKPDVFVTECYVLGEKDFKNDFEIEKKTRELVVKWENGNKAVWEIWENVLSYAYQGINNTLNRLGNHWDKVWWEHEHYQDGKDFIEKGLEKGIFQKLEDGAVLTNLEKYNIPDTILLKKDGTSLYITQDIALTSIKKKTYNADKLVWVIGPEQSLAMKQLFTVSEQLGIGKVKDFTHVSYGYVGLKSGDGGFKKMSSREGTVVLIDDVIDNVKEKIKRKFVQENKDQDKDIESISEKLALGAVKFSILKSDRNQNLTFDLDQSINVNGDSGVHVMYSYVRTQSILRKANKNISEKIIIPEQFGEEEFLIRSLLFFPGVIMRSQEDLSVHHIAIYLLEISSEFNSWYGKETILDGSEKEDYKLAITKAVGVVLKNGLEILGIDIIKEI
jgi:arginyl-tRNA synthetase